MSGFNLEKFRTVFLKSDGWQVSDCYKTYDDKFLRKDAQDAYEGAKWAWQEQQAKIDLLENEIVETQEFLNKQNHIKQAKIDEMQKRIDGALGIAQITISGKGNSVAIATCRGLAREIEKALRGGDQNTKNKAQSIENTGHEGGDQKALRGEHESN